MRIYGFQKTTLLDYPEHVAATVFTGGCNFRCPYCQNAELVFAGGCGQGHVRTAQEIPEAEVFAHLKKRRGVLDGVCITGGEPTLQPDLEEFIRRVRELGYKVKLDSNGYRPKVLGQLLDRGLLDYVAMDVKACRDNYARAVGLIQIQAAGVMQPAGSVQSGNSPRKEPCGMAFEPERIRESIALLRDSGIAYEFRTTAVKGLHTVEEFGQIGRELAGSKAYFIQNYRESEGGLNSAGLSGFDREELLEMKRLAERYIERVELRGVD